MKLSSSRTLFSSLNSQDATPDFSFPHRVAIIDIGSNSIKIRIYEIISSSSHKVLYEDRDMIRLGKDVFQTQHLPIPSFEKAAETLNSFQKIVQKFDTNDVVVKATSAVREAKNVDLFLKYIKNNTGLSIDVLSGQDEAQYVYLAALSSIEFLNRTILLVDIGGGSTEVCVATEKELLISESLPIGTVRLMQTFFPEHDSNQNYTEEKLRIMEVYVQKQVNALRKKITKLNPEFILAFGGTPNNLGEVAQKNSIGLEKDGCLGFSYDRCIDLYTSFAQSSPQKISRIRGIEPKRSDIMLGGTLIIKSIAEMAGHLDTLTSPKGLREGIMMEYISSRINPNIYQQRQADFQMKSVRMLAEKFNVSASHAQQVEKIAAELFHQLQPLHQLNKSSLNLARAAAYLHDIGMVINYKDHHKHSYYIITQSTLSGFTQEEKETIGLISRYHRKSNPKNSHSNFRGLNETRKKEVIHLAAILRLADALDQSYKSLVKSLDCDIRDMEIEIKLHTGKNSDLTLEKWGIERKKEFAEKLWNRKIIINQV